MSHSFWNRDDNVLYPEKPVKISAIWKNNTVKWHKKFTKKWHKKVDTDSDSTVIKSYFRNEFGKTNWIVKSDVLRYVMFNKWLFYYHYKLILSGMEIIIVNNKWFYSMIKVFDYNGET